MYNKVLLIGNVVKDPESRTVKSTSVSKFRLAVDDPYKKDSVLYIDVEAWDKQAEFADKWLKKGKGVIVDGRLCMDSWEKDGKKETKIFVKAQDIRFSNVGSPKSENDDQSKESSKNSKPSKPQQTEQAEIDEFADVPF
jgi:single-strand DNA-binding protein